MARQRGYARSEESFGYASEMNPKLKGKKVPLLEERCEEEFCAAPFNHDAAEVRTPRARLPPGLELLGICFFLEEIAVHASTCSWLTQMLQLKIQAVLPETSLPCTHDGHVCSELRSSVSLLRSPMCRRARRKQRRQSSRGRSSPEISLPS